MFTCEIGSSVGPLTLACHKEGTTLAALWMAGQHFMEPSDPEEPVRRGALPLKIALLSPEGVDTALLKEPRVRS